MNWQCLLRNVELLGRKLGWPEALTEGLAQQGLLSEEHRCDAVWQKIFALANNQGGNGENETACFYVSTFMFLRHLSEYWKASQKNCFVVEGFAEHMQVTSVLALCKRDQ